MSKSRTHILKTASNTLMKATSKQSSSDSAVTGRSRNACNATTPEAVRIKFLKEAAENAKLSQSNKPSAPPDCISAELLEPSTEIQDTKRWSRKACTATTQDAVRIKFLNEATENPKLSQSNKPSAPPDCIKAELLEPSTEIQDTKRRSRKACTATTQDAVRIKFLNEAAENTKLSQSNKPSAPPDCISAELLEPSTEIQDTKRRSRKACTATTQDTVRIKFLNEAAENTKLSQSNKPSAPPDCISVALLEPSTEIQDTKTDVCVGQEQPSSQGTEAKCVIICQDTKTSSDKTDQGGASQGRQFVGESYVYRRTIVCPSKVMSMKTEHSQVVKTHHIKKITTSELRALTPETKRPNFFTRARKTSVKKSTSESVLQHTPQKTKTRSSPSLIGFHHAAKEPQKAEKSSTEKRKKLKRRKSASRKHSTGRKKSQNRCAEQSKLTSDAFKQLQIYNSSFGNDSDSSKLSEPNKTPLRKAVSGASPPRHSKKQLSMILHSVRNQELSNNVYDKQHVSRKPYLPYILPSKMASVMPNENHDFISVSLSPQNFFYTSEKISSLPMQESRQAFTGIPRKCLAYENLIQVPKKGKSIKHLKKCRLEKNRHTVTAFQTRNSINRIVYKRRGSKNIIKKRPFAKRRQVSARNGSKKRKCSILEKVVHI